MSQSRYARAFRTQAAVPVLDLDDYVGQRSETYRFDYLDAITGYRTAVHPLEPLPSIVHNTGQTIVRQLRSLTFGVAESDLINVISGRIQPFMLVGGHEYPLGTYMFNNKTEIDWTSGTISNCTLYDEGFIVDQELEESFGVPSGGGYPTSTNQVDLMLDKLLRDLPIALSIEPSPYSSNGSWGAGTRRGSVVEQLAIDGDYLAPWFDNDGVMRFIRTFDPADSPVTFDLDAGNRVIRGRVVRSNDLTDAPNRFIIIGNGVNAQSAAVVGTYDIPASAPHSIPNRGFVAPHVETRQIEYPSQAAAVARNLGQRALVFEQLEISTAPDPRHDAYDVIRWNGDNWLELAWTLQLEPGAEMEHRARKVYTP